MELPHVPEREKKQRNKGITMVMDKGLSQRQAEDMIAAAGDYIDVVKFGFGTSLITKDLKKKIKIYKEAGIRPYFGGTLFEVFAIRDKLDDYQRYLEENEIDLLEISDGSMKMEHHVKIKYITEFKKHFTVLSEVGSKQAGVEIPTKQWIQMMKDELEAGVWKVITEARESGNIGIYNPDGSANMVLIEDILEQISQEQILWEAPIKKQQVWFIKLLGADVNLGNIATNEVIPLETLRLGLRGDTFFQYLPDDLKS